MAADAKLKKNPAAVALGRLGGLKGGKARAATLTGKRRRRDHQSVLGILLSLRQELGSPLQP
jgi:hypothetical protein